MIATMLRSGWWSSAVVAALQRCLEPTLTVLPTSAAGHRASAAICELQPPTAPPAACSTIMCASNATDGAAAARVPVRPRADLVSAKPQALAATMHSGIRSRHGGVAVVNARVEWQLDASTAIVVARGCAVLLTRAHRLQRLPAWPGRKHSGRLPGAHASARHDIIHPTHLRTGVAATSYPAFSATARAFAAILCSAPAALMLTRCPVDYVTASTSLAAPSVQSERKVRSIYQLYRARAASVVAAVAGEPLPVASAAFRALLALVVLEGNMESAGAVERACRVLCSMADDSCARAGIPLAGGIRTVVHALQCHTANRAVASVALSLLSHMLMVEGNRAVLAAAGGLPVVVAALTAHAACQPLATSGCWALAMVAADTSCIEPILAAGGMQAIACVLRATHQKATFTAAVAALSNLTCSPAGQHAAVKTDAVPALRHALHAWSGDVTTRRLQSRAGAAAEQPCQP